MKLLLTLTLTSLLILACGEEQHSNQDAQKIEVTPEAYQGAQLLDTLAQIEMCAQEKYREIIYVIETQLFYYCHNNEESEVDEWLVLEIKGKDGRDGVDGIAGKDGVDGIAGIAGKDGVDGPSGRDGVNGIDGKNGLDGAKGTAIIQNDPPVNIQLKIDYLYGTNTPRFQSSTYSLTQEQFEKFVYWGPACELETLSEALFTCNFRNSKPNCNNGIGTNYVCKEIKINPSTGGVAIQTY